MPRLFFDAPTRVKVFLFVLTLLPCVPGTLFLFAGWLREPRPPARDALAAEQARSLHQAGFVVLGVGALCGTAVGWKFIRRRDDDRDNAG